MISNQDFDLISALDLNPIKMKLAHPQSGEGWSAEHVDAIETEYRRFLYLMKAFPSEQTAPLEDVDTFWHYHILDTMKYAADCEQVFGYFLHHYPYLGMVGEDGPEILEQAGERTRALYESIFGEPYLRTDVAAVDGAWCGRAPANTAEALAAWCGRAPEAAAKNAWCGRAPVQAEAVHSAWCGRAPVKAEAADVQTAWCGRAPALALAA
jgi:hypothetical protein